MELNQSENLQASAGKNFSLTWTDYFSSFRFYSDGQEYLARNYAFNIVEGERRVRFLVRFTVATDEAGILEFERVYRRKITQSERSNIAKRKIREVLDCVRTLGIKNLAEVRPDLLMGIVQDLGIEKVASA